jgi:hypothetical protein
MNLINVRRYRGITANQIKCSTRFAFQINESTYVTGLPQLLVFVRYCFEENIHEDFMFC